VDLGLGIEFARRQLDHCRKHVRFGIRIHAGPGRLAAQMRLGEVPFAAGIEQVLDSFVVEKERVAAAASKNVMLPAVMMLGLGPNETSPSEIIFFPTASAERDSAPFAMNTFTVWVPFRGFENT